MKNLDLAELPPNLRAKVLAFRRELIAERDFCVAFRKKVYRSMWAHEHNVPASPRGQRG
jgi:hypothetical protein